MLSRLPQESPYVTEPDVVDVAAEIEAELARLDVSAVLLHAATTVATLAYRRLPEGERDLEQVRLAIDALRALLPVLEDSLTDELRRDFRTAIADLQLAYGDAVGRSFQ
jgi:hypothetical protein